MEERYVCPDCEKKYKSKSWFKFHLSQHKAWVKAVDLGIIITIILWIFYYPPFHIYYTTFGKLHIDLKENELKEINGISYVKIEVLNDLGYPLLDVRGKVHLDCDIINDTIKSEIFKLEEGRDFLALGGKSEFLLTRDLLFTNLIETRGYDCSDAFVLRADYKRIDEGTAKLLRVNEYNLFEESDNILKTIYGPNETFVGRICMYCNATIIIYGSNKTFEHTENLKFIGKAERTLFPEIVYTPTAPTEEFFLFIQTGIVNLKICEGLSKDECFSAVCEKLKRKFEEKVACDEIIASGSFEPRVFSPLEVNITIRQN